MWLEVVQRCAPPPDPSLCKSSSSSSSPPLLHKVHTEASQAQEVPSNWSCPHSSSGRRLLNKQTNKRLESQGEQAGLRTRGQPILVSGSVHHLHTKARKEQEILAYLARRREPRRIPAPRCCAASRSSCFRLSRSASSSPLCSLSLLFFFERSAPLLLSVSPVVTLPQALTIHGKNEADLRWPDS